MHKNNNPRNRRFFYKGLGIGFIATISTFLVTAPNANHTHHSSYTPYRIEVDKTGKPATCKLLRSELYESCKIVNVNSHQTGSITITPSTTNESIKVNYPKESRPVYAAEGRLEFSVTTTKKEDNNIIYAILLSSMVAGIIIFFWKQKTIKIFILSLDNDFIPEECVAELTALSQQLKSKNYPSWLIQFVIIKSILELIFNLYIQIKVENILRK